MFAMLGLVRETFRGRESLGLAVGPESGKQNGRVCGVLVMGLLSVNKKLKMAR